MLGFETYDQSDTPEDEGVRHVPIEFDIPIAEWRKITRADLVFEGVGHIAQSYEVEVFLNNKKAKAGTPHTAAKNYAGRFVVFGHGDCFGGVGHCSSTETVGRSAVNSAAPQLEHPASPHRRILTVTKAMDRIMKKYKNGLHTVTLVTTLKAPRIADRKPVSGLLKCKRISLQVYS